MAYRSPLEGGRVTALMNGYHEDTGKRPFVFLRDQTSEEEMIYQARSSPGFRPREVTIHDGRGKNLTLDENSFQLISHPTSLTTEDFYQNKEKITSLYYGEIMEAMRRVTGASFVHILHHQVRNATIPTTPRGVPAPVKGYANGIHSDSHPRTGDAAFKRVLRAAQSRADALRLDLDLSKGRYLQLNAWRNISHFPIWTDPLAVCDESSLCKPEDYLTADVFRPERTVQQFKLNARNASRHRWYYFPHMERDEVLLFKLWDSDPTLTGRCCFHSAFKDPTSPPDVPVRESIEIRALCFFPYHTPNTCPEVAAALSDDDPAVRITEAVKDLRSWPLPARKSAVMACARPGGPRMVVVRLVKDERGIFGLNGLSEAERLQIVSRLMKSPQEGGTGFVAELRKAVQGLEN